MKTEEDAIGKIPMGAAITVGVLALLLALAGTAWFGTYQFGLLRSISEDQAFYKDLVECRASLAALDARMGDPDVSVSEQRSIQDRLVLERARFAETGRREALRKDGKIAAWLNGGLLGTREQIDRESLGLLLIEMDGLISGTAKKISTANQMIAASLHAFLVFIVLSLFAILLAAWRLLVSNYRHSLLPLHQLANRLTQLNRNIPESVHDTAEAASTILSDPEPSAEIRYVTESVAGLCRDIEEKNKKLDEIYIRDEKTSLYNYRHFKEHLIIDVERAKRFGDSISLAMIDIDHFKRYNDAFGHVAGDRVLARIAAIIRETCRVTDIPSRFGGEEFAILFPKTDRQLSIEIAERLRQIIAIEPFGQISGQGHRGQITVSIGVATWPDDAVDWYSLINNADQALYQAKDTGRNQVVGFVADQNRN